MRPGLLVLSVGAKLGVSGGLSQSSCYLTHLTGILCAAVLVHGITSACVLRNSPNQQNNNHSHRFSIYFGTAAHSQQQCKCSIFLYFFFPCGMAVSSAAAASLVANKHLWSVSSRPRRIFGACGTWKHGQRARGLAWAWQSGNEPRRKGPNTGSELTVVWAWMGH
jgi:hypothetical protein